MRDPDGSEALTGGPVIKLIVLLLGLAIFRLIALLMTGIPLLRELKKG